MMSVKCCSSHVSFLAPRISLLYRIRQYLSTYNIFVTPSSTVDTRRREVLSTRLYLVILIVCTIILVSYAGLAEQSKNQMVERPSQLTYEYLQSLDTDILQCPCSTISMPYASFMVHLNASVHPVCSSDFISPVWQTFINQYGKGSSLWLQLFDFRKWGILLFNLLGSLCSLSNETLADAINQVRTSSFVSSEALTTNQFQVQVNEALQSLQKSVSTLFARSLQLFRDSNQGNALISILNNNWKVKYGQNTSYAPLLLAPTTYNNGTCSCATSSACVEPAAFYNLTAHKVYIIDGIVFGCFALESILRSSLACFFSNSCLLRLENTISLGNPSGHGAAPKRAILPIQFPPSQSRFRVDDTIETLVNGMFLDSWLNETSYERYYNSCAPTYCSYSFRRRLNIILALTTFLSVFNGLSIALQVMIPPLMKLGYKLRNRCRVQPGPISS